MKETYMLAAAGSIILLNGFIGHNFAPFGIFLTPVILGIVSAIIMFGLVNKHNVLKVLLVLSGIIFNDFLIRKYSGGIHDSEGFAWITLYLFYGLILSYLIVLTGVFSSKDKLSNKLIASCIFPVLTLLYMGIR